MDGNKIIKDPIVVTSHDSTSTVSIPVCAVCQLGKQKRRGGGTTKTRKLVSMKLKINILEPGQMVSTDKFVIREKGRLHHTKGREKKEDCYCGGTVFVDHDSSYVFIQNQVRLINGETILAKRKFEKIEKYFGVDIKSYRYDNGIYKVRSLYPTWKLEIRS